MKLAAANSRGLCLVELFFVWQLLGCGARDPATEQTVDAPADAPAETAAKPTGMIEAPWYRQSQEVRLRRAPSNTFGRRPTSESKPFELSPTDSQVRASADSADGRFRYALVGNSIVLVDLESGQEVRRVHCFAVQDIGLCGDKLGVHGAKRRHYEYFEAGRFQKHWERPPGAGPSVEVIQSEIWLLDAETLRVKRGYDVLGDSVVFARDAPLAIVTSRSFSLDYLDLEDGNRLASYSLSDNEEAFGLGEDHPAHKHLKFESVELSADGRSVLMEVRGVRGNQSARLDWDGKSFVFSSAGT